MNVLITGGRGYIGKSLVDNLFPSHNITVVSKKDIDLTDYAQVANLFSGKKFDTVIHCAVVGGNRLEKDSWKVQDTNLKMYYNIMAHRKNFHKLIHFGSGAELTLLDSPYGISKKVIANSISEIDNFFNLRLYAVFDTNELDQRFIKSNIIRYLKKHPIRIHQDKFMDFFYMEDLCKVVNYYINNDVSILPKLVECSYEKKYLLSDIANIINNLDNHKVPIVIEHNGLSRDYTGKASLNMDLQGLEEGIKTTYNQLKKLF
jgi:GDP-L-fucose synthase